jgi:hypothetical protein
LQLESGGRLVGFGGRPFRRTLLGDGTGVSAMKWEYRFEFVLFDDPLPAPASIVPIQPL